MSGTLEPLDVVIGFDRDEVAAYHTLCNSIIRHTPRLVRFTPLYLPALEASGLMWRKDRGSTDFSFSRFLAPYLTGYRGKVLFMDCDMVVRADIGELFDGLPLDKCVGVVKHDYRPKSDTKFLGRAQHAYPKKLWSALMVFNGSSSRVRALTPKVVNESDGPFLHQFGWTAPHRIHEFGEEWQWIPDHSEARIPVEDARCVHYTEGGPWFREYANCSQSGLWLDEFKQASAIQDK